MGIERTTLGALASIIRSKNAGPYRLTFDVLFDDEAAFRTVTESRAITRETIAALFSIDADRITSIHELPAGLAIKITLLRPRAQCAPGETDVYGCQQHAPLIDLEVPIGGNYPRA